MAIEKAPSKNWELTLYEMQRKPQPLITDDSEIAICPLRLSNELKCPICLDFLSNTMATKECLHRFCSQCIVTALRSGNKECPACRKKLVSKRSLRRDVNFDAIIAKLFPYRKEYEAHQANVMAKQIRNSTRSSKTNCSERQNDKSVENNFEPQENTTNNSSSNHETESGSSKDQSSTTSNYPLKYRNMMKYNDRTSSTMQSDNNSTMQVDEDLSVTASEAVLPQIRVRQPSSESGGPETNCSSSVTSELCSLIGTQGRDSVGHSNNTTIDKSQTYSFSESNIDVILEPLDGRTGKNKLNETFTVLISDIATVGHLIEFLHIKRSESQKMKRNSLESEPAGKAFKSLHFSEDVTYNIYLGMTTNEKKSLNSSQDPNRQSSSSIIRTTRKSMNRKLESVDKLCQIISEYSLNKKKMKKDRIKQKSMNCSEFLVFYYQEVSLKNAGTSLEILN